MLDALTTATSFRSFISVALSTNARVPLPRRRHPSVRWALVSRSINAFFLWCRVVWKYSSQVKIDYLKKNARPAALSPAEMANDNKEIGDIVKKCKILLLDVEGTTTSISFVKVGLNSWPAGVLFQHVMILHSFTYECNGLRLNRYCLNPTKFAQFFLGFVWEWEMQNGRVLGFATWRTKSKWSLLDYSLIPL